MKRSFLFTLLGVSLVANGWAQTADFYENDGIITCPPDVPPQIDAYSFVNVGAFTIDFTNLSVNTTLFTTASTLNFTNRGFMSSNQGFEFDTEPTISGQKRMAANFYNSGVINAGSSSNFTSIGTVFFAFGLPKLIVSATNLINPGTNIMGFDSVCSFKGQNVDFSRGTLAVQDSGASVVGTNIIFTGGQFDGYWGLDTNLINPAVDFEFTTPAFTPPHLVTNRNYNLFIQQWNNQNGLSYISDQTDITGSNRFVRAVFMINTNLDVDTQVFFPFGGDITIQWAVNTTNNTSGSVITNFLYLFDTYGIFTNQQVLFNGSAGAGFARPTYIPANFFFTQTPSPFFLGAPTVSGPIPGGTFPAFGLTNESAAYEALFVPSTQVLTDVANQDVTNLPGRVEIVADKVLDLSFARIASANYLEIRATNHFVGSKRAQISSPFAVVNLRSTNGLLTVTNLMSPFLKRPEGTIDCYATRFTNFVGGITNTFHVLFVNSKYSGHSPSRVEDLLLQSTNTLGGTDTIVINDMMTVTRNLLLNTANLIIATNDPGSPSPTGGIIVTDPRIVWSTATPRLQNLTNYGTIQAVSAIFFGGSRSSPFYSSNFNQPYVSFINHGTVTNSGSLIWANTFLNSGTFYSGIGDVQLQGAQTAILTNGAFLAPNGNNNISAGSLFVSNHVLLSGAALSLSITNLLDDGSLTATNLDTITNKNVWTAKGVNLLNLPARGSLLATTITNNDPTYGEIVNQWAARDVGPDPAGFTNQQNSALGRLILVGQDADSLFTFKGTGAANALYVDLIEFRGSLVTNRDSVGNFNGIQFAPNMKIYYGQAMANGISIAEKLSGKNSANGFGGFYWASNYAGFYSGTNLVYPDGRTNRLNTALVTSCDIDSNTNGIVNCQDPAPVFIPDSGPVVVPLNLALTVSLGGPSPDMAHISWNSVPYSTNYLYASSSTVMTNCQVVTNFVLGPLGGRVTVTETVRTNNRDFTGRGLIRHLVRRLSSRSVGRTEAMACGGFVWIY